MDSHNPGEEPKNKPTDEIDVRADAPSSDNGDEPSLPSGDSHEERPPEEAALDQLEKDHPTRLSKIGLYIKSHPVKASLLVLFTLLGLAAFVAATVFTAGAFAGVGFATATIAGAAANGGALAILFGTLPAFAVTAGTAGLIGAAIAGVLSYAAWTKTTFKDGWHRFVIEKQMKLSGGSKKPVSPRNGSEGDKPRPQPLSNTDTHKHFERKKTPRKKEEPADPAPAPASYDFSTRYTIIPSESVEGKIIRARTILEKIKRSTQFNFNELIDLATDSELKEGNKYPYLVKELETKIRDKEFRDAYLGLKPKYIQPMSLIRFVQFTQTKLLSVNEGNGDAKERFNQLYEFYFPIYEKLSQKEIPPEFNQIVLFLREIHASIQEEFADYLTPKNENESQSRPSSNPSSTRS